MIFIIANNTTIPERFKTASVPHTRKVVINKIATSGFIAIKDCFLLYQIAKICCLLKISKWSADKKNCSLYSFILINEEEDNCHLIIIKLIILA